MSIEYLAGLIDGEGNLRIYKNHSYWNQFQISVKMTHKETISKLKDSFNGFIYEDDPKEKGYKRAWRWVLRNNEACALVKKILPYLITKHEEAELFLEAFGNIKSGRDYRKKLPTQADIDMQLFYFQKLKDLKRNDSYIFIGA